VQRVRGQDFDRIKIGAQKILEVACRASAGVFGRPAGENSGVGVPQRRDFRLRMIDVAAHIESKTAGFEVVSVSRGERAPYQPNGSWKFVRAVILSREAEQSAESFGRKIRDLRPDIVIDMICFTEASARHLVEALRGEVQHFLHTGTIWVHGPSVEVPTTEMQPRRPFGEYGIEKARIEAYLLEMAQKNSFPATIIHPGHIVGPGWAPLNPAGHFNPSVFTKLAEGEELSLPNFGLETVHHVHAEDVAQVFMCAIAHRSASVGEAFHAVSPAAITLRGYAEAMAAWFGRAISRLKRCANR